MTKQKRAEVGDDRTFKPMLEPGLLLANRYRIESVLGKGGMGCVYLARLEALGGKAVAIKEMAIQATDDKSRDAAVKQFRLEGSLLANLDHPNLVQVSDFFEEEGRYYLVMAYIKGTTLLETLRARTGPIPVSEVIDWALQLCAVLEYLHTQTPPIIFRDLKPANIMLDESRKVRLIDFGIARAFQPEQVTATFLQGVGSAGYSPLEQYTGTGSTDPRSDIYSLGATLFHLATDKIPPSPAEIVALSQKMPSAREFNPSVPAALDQVLSRMMALRKEDRYANIAATRRAIDYVRTSLGQNDEATEQLGVAPQIAAPATNLIQPEPKGPWVASALAVTAVCAALGFKMLAPEVAPTSSPTPQPIVHTSQVEPEHPSFPVPVASVRPHHKAPRPVKVVAAAPRPKAPTLSAESYPTHHVHHPSLPGSDYPISHGEEHPRETVVTTQQPPPPQQQPGGPPPNVQPYPPPPPGYPPPPPGAPWPPPPPPQAQQRSPIGY